MGGPMLNASPDPGALMYSLTVHRDYVDRIVLPIGPDVSDRSVVVPLRMDRLRKTRTKTRTTWPVRFAPADAPGIRRFDAFMRAWNYVVLAFVVAFLAQCLNGGRR